jgi:hypothetical protein
VPTRRIFELIVVTAIVLHPVFGMFRMWAQKTLANPDANGLFRGAAEITTVVS